MTMPHACLEKDAWFGNLQSVCMYLIALTLQIWKNFGFVGDVRGCPGAYTYHAILKPADRNCICTTVSDEQAWRDKASKNCRASTWHQYKVICFCLLLCLPYLRYRWRKQSLSHNSLALLLCLLAAAALLELGTRCSVDLHLELACRPSISHEFDLVLLVFTCNLMWYYWIYNCIKTLAEDATLQNACSAC